MFISLGYFTSFSQISAGGKPYSFHSDALAAEITFSVMPKVDLDYLKQEDALNEGKPMPWRFGATMDADIDLTKNGKWETLPSGDRLWRVGIYSQGALTLNFLLNKFYLPEGASLFIYNQERTTVLGAFTSFNNRPDSLFGTDVLKGDKVIFEYYEPNKVQGKGSLHITNVIHGYRGWNGFFARKNTTEVQNSGACNININCPVAEEWEVEKRSVCIIISGGSGLCTGAMITDVPQTGTPYFLTANHCTQGINNFGNWVFRFNYESDDCNGTTGPTSQSISGATLRARRAGSDFALLELSSAPPEEYGAVYAGWSRLGVEVDSAVCIHHPSGDIKKFTKAANQTVSGNYSGAECWQALWTLGVTEGGSSGSPLFDPEHRIIGQLFGGASACGVSQDNMNDWYGKFDVSWDAGGSSTSRLKEWLDPQNTDALTADTYDPFLVLVPLDASVSSAAFQPAVQETCLDSVSVSFRLRNRGTDTIFTAEIQAVLNGTPYSTISYTNTPLAYNQNTLINVGNVPLEVGLNTFQFEILTINETSDTNATNNIVAAQIIRIAPESEDVPIVNGFQTSAFPSLNFTVENPDNDVTWVRTTSAGGFGQSSSSAWLNFYDYDAAGSRDYLEFPFFQLNNDSQDVSLQFDVAYAPYSQFNNDSLAVQISSDCGQTWSQLYLKGNLQLATNNGNYTQSNFVPTSAQWRRDSISLNSFRGQSDLLIRFEARNGYGNNLYLDNINVSYYIPDTTGGIGLDEAFYGGISVYPNPADKEVVIQSLNNRFTSLMVHNQLGQLVRTEQFSPSIEFKMDMVELNQGVYTISVIDENGLSARYKLLKL